MRVVFMGSPEFAVPSLRALLSSRHEVALVVAQPDKPAGRGRHLRACPVKEVADEVGVDVAQPRSARKRDFLKLLQQADAEIALVVAYGKILPVAVIECFPRGIINVHASLLPAYRGAAPINWALIRGEEQTGVTIMQIDEGMDTGPMLLRESIPIDPTDTAGTLSGRLAVLGARLAVQALDQLATGALEPRAQDPALATYAPMMSKADGVIDWNGDARGVAARIRGVDPWPGAHTTWREQSLKLFGASLASSSPLTSKPGTIVSIDERGMCVACAPGVVRIEAAQPANRRRAGAAELARGRVLSVGGILGE